MTDNIDKAKKALEHSKNSLAFVFGNGINRYANVGTSWENLLLSISEKYSTKHKCNIPDGISFTEFYDVVLLGNKERSDIAQAVVAKMDEWKPQEYHEKLQLRLKELDVPVMTTNFDRIMDVGLNKRWLNNGSLNI